MRIVGGALRGRRIQASADRRARPTGDRVREAWFNILGERVAGARVVDLFAGSGALGLEALSRGAEHATFVELSPGGLRALRTNVTQLEVAERCAVRRGDALRYAGKLAEGAFDVAFADPPYTTNQADRLVSLYRTCAFAAVLGVEHPASVSVAGDEIRRYGNTSITFCYPP